MPKGFPGRPAATCYPDRLHDALGLCGPCHRRFLYYKNHEREKEAARHSMRKSKFGISKLEFQQLLIAQNNLCVICNKPQPGRKALAIDHDHRTGKIRGLLCSWCNRAVGYLEDSAERAEATAKYLRSKSN